MCLTKDIIPFQLASDQQIIFVGLDSASDLQNYK